MPGFLEFLIGFLTLGLPLWFAFLDQRAFPGMRWVAEGRGTPVWGNSVVVVGVVLAVLIALAAPISGFHPSH